jgi:hypothetical protein
VHVDLIERYQDFLALREAWDAVYDADPDAQVFVSWRWMATWLNRREVDGRNAGGWVILIAKASPAATSCLAILPVRVRPGEGGGAPRLTMAGRRFADYSGILYRPEARQEAIPALVQCVKRMRWQHWQLEFLRCAPEVLRLLLGSFSRHRLPETKAINKGEDADNSICPYVDLRRAETSIWRAEASPAPALVGRRPSDPGPPYRASFTNAF